MAIELGIPTNRKASGSKTRNAAAVTLPHRFRIPPIMAMESMKIYSANRDTCWVYVAIRLFGHLRQIVSCMLVFYI